MRTFARRRTQVVREQSAKLRCGGSNPPGASNFLFLPLLYSRQESEPVQILCARQVWLSGRDRDRMTGAWRKPR